MSSSPESSHPALDAIAALLAPLARLALSQGLTAPHLDEAMRRALVQVSKEMLLAQGLAEHRLVSRISASVGLTRREVMRLTQLGPAGQLDPGGSLAAEVFTRWAADPALRDAQGRRQPLRRLGPAPSFEALARSVTQDVHPRSLLEELCRLGMARLDDEGDTVSLLREAFVPGQDRAHMLRFLADNVGDHLSGAVDNVLANGPSLHFDQAVFADELSAASLQAMHAFIAGQWRRLLEEAVPVLEQHIDADKQAGRPQDKRLRVGLYSYENDMAPPQSPVRPAIKAKLPVATKAAGATRKSVRKRSDHG